MAVFPIPRRGRSFQGPHSTCLYSACGVNHASKLPNSEHKTYNVYMTSHCTKKLIHFLLHLGLVMLMSLLWVAFSALYFLQYVILRMLQRVQYKLSICLLLLGHEEPEFNTLEDFIDFIKNCMKFNTAMAVELGFCFLSFVDI